jgi:hypothetical protein
MVWDPDAIGGREDSFAAGWVPTNVTFTKIDGDYCKLELPAGKTSGYIKKDPVSINAATYKYCVYRVKGTDNHWIQTYGTDGWKYIVNPGTQAPSEYEIRVVYLPNKGINGTITVLIMGVDGAPGDKAWYDFIEFHSSQHVEPADVSSMRVLQREGGADYFRSEWLEGESDPFTKGRYIRIIAGRDSNVEKIFSGVIEESNLKEGGIREVAGRCFQVKVQAATKTKTFTNRELSLAVKDIVEDFDEISTSRVKTPSPTINISKEYVDAHISDVLDQLASVPSKQSLYDAWRWKIGYGQDLRFRSEVDSDILTCSTSISEGTNLLAGVKKGSDLYELCNKVKAISGFVQYPGSDGWCEDAAGWSIYHGTKWNETTKGLIKVGEKSIKVVYTGEGPPYNWYVYRTFTAKDMTAYQRIPIYFRLGTGWKAGVNTFEIRYYSAGGGYWYYMIDDSNNEREDNVWHFLEIDLDDPNWEKSGDPSWTDINEVRLFWVTGSEYTPENPMYVWFDGLCFEVDNMECTASDPSSPVKGDRVLVYKDEKINDVEKLQDLADGLLQVVKAAAERIMLPVAGAPDLQRGRKVTATSSTFGLSGSYVIAEAEHVFDRSIGYVTLVMLDRSRYALPADLRRTIEQELRREKLGTVNVL